MKKKLKKGSTVKIYNVNMKQPINTVFTVGEVFQDTFEATCGSYIDKFKKGKLPSKYVVFSKDRIYTEPKNKFNYNYFFETPHRIECENCGSYNTIYVGDNDHFCHKCKHMTNW